MSQNTTVSNAMIDRRRMLLGGTAAAAALALLPFATRAHAQADDEVVAWLKANAVPLATAEPGSGFADLAPLRAAIGAARVVSLGEATHGTREFFQLKHRMMEYCVSELGFNVIGFEAQHGATLAINDYVLGGKGNAADAVSGMGFWVWDTDEVVALVEWVRKWNDSHERKVKFYGFDMQSASPSVLHLLAYLERVAPEFAQASERALAPLISGLMEPYFGSLPEAAQSAVLAHLKTTIAAFETHRSEWSGKTGALDWHLAKRSAVVAEQCARIWQPAMANDFFASFQFRDRCMADNVHAMLETEGPGAKALLWAHNGHVQRKPYMTDDFHNMGSYLHAELGSDMVVFAFAFNQGGFAAVNYGEGPRVLRDFVVGPAPDDFFDAVLAKTGVPMFALDLRRVPEGSAVARWMAELPLQRSIGAVFHPGQESSYAQEGDPRENSDFILFVETTTAARRDWSRREGRSVGNGTNETPANLALTGAAGAGLEGWAMTSLGVHRYGLTPADGRAPAGGDALRMAREAGQLPFGDGVLTQSFSAERWRGKRLVLKASMRAQAEGLGTGARLAAAVFPVEKPANPMSPISMLVPISIAQTAGAVRASEWSEHKVAVDVPADADRIMINLMLTGGGSAWFGDLALEATDMQAMSAPQASRAMPARSARPVPTPIAPPTLLQSRY